MEDGKSFMEQVRHDLQQIQFRYGTTAEEKTSPEVQSETKKYIAKEDEEDTESRQLSELIVAESNKVADGKSEKPHEGEIVVTSYRLNPKSHKEPVRQVPIIFSCSLSNKWNMASLKQLDFRKILTGTTK